MAKGKKYNWRLEVNGLLVGKAQTVKIPKTSRDVAEFSEGADEYLTKEPMRPKVDNATITGLVLSGDSFFMDWFRNPVPRLMIVYLLDDQERVLRKYELKKCFPIGVDVDELDYKNTSEFVMETLELAVKEVVVQSR